MRLPTAPRRRRTRLGWPGRSSSPSPCSRASTAPRSGTSSTSPPPWKATCSICARWRARRGSTATSPPPTRSAPFATRSARDGPSSPRACAQQVGSARTSLASLRRTPPLRRAPTIWWWDAPSRALPTLPKRLPPSSRRCARDPYPRARDPDAPAPRDRHHALRRLHPQVGHQVALLHRPPRGHLLPRRAPAHRRAHGRRGEPLRRRSHRGHSLRGAAPGRLREPSGQPPVDLPAERGEELRDEAAHRGHLSGRRPRRAHRRHHYGRRQQVRGHRRARGGGARRPRPRHPHRPRAGWPRAPRLQGLRAPRHPDHLPVPRRVGDRRPRGSRVHRGGARLREGLPLRLMAILDTGLGETLFDEETIRAEVARLAAQISADYADKTLHLVGVLKGAAVFLADLLRALSIPATMDFISIVPYGQVTASGVVRIRKDLDEPLEGRDVLVVEGICASGLSLSYLLRNFQTRGPASIKTCAFVAKRRVRPADITLDYVGREIPDVFVVGYGLDAQERYRNLPYIARLS